MVKYLDSSAWFCNNQCSAPSLFGGILPLLASILRVLIIVSYLENTLSSHHSIENLGLSSDLRYTLNISIKE